MATFSALAVLRCDLSCDKAIVGVRGMNFVPMSLPGAITTACCVPTMREVNDMRGFVTVASIIPGVSTTVTIAIAALVVALIIGVVAFFLFRGSGKKKAGEAPPAGTSDWQRQQAGAGGQQAPWGQQNQQQQ